MLIIWLHINCCISHCKNFENRLSFDRVTATSLDAHFFLNTGYVNMSCLLTDDLLGQIWLRNWGWTSFWLLNCVNCWWNCRSWRNCWVFVCLCCCRRLSKVWWHGRNFHLLRSLRQLTRRRCAMSGYLDGQHSISLSLPVCLCVTYHVCVLATVLPEEKANTLFFLAEGTSSSAIAEGRATP